MHKVCIRYVIFLHQVCITIPLAEHTVHQVCQMQTLQTWCTLDSVCHWPLGVVGGPAHGPRADVVEPVASARPSVLVAFPQRKELPLAASQRRRNGAVVPRWDERQPSQDGGDWHNVDDWLLRLIQLLCPAHASLLPPGGDSPGARRLHKVFTSLHRVCIKSAYLPCAYLAYENKKVCQMHTCMLVCMISA
jgi:hypothetical protein